MEKRAKRLALVGLAAAMTAALLSGCGGKPKAVKATPENLLRDMADRVDDIESVLMNIQFEMELSGGAEAMAIGFDIDMESTMDPEKSYAKGVISIGMSGTSFDTELEMYSVEEEDQYVTYTKVADQWTKETDSAEEALGDMEGMAGDIEEYADHFELESDLAEINDRECFELTGELEGDIFADLFASGMMDSFSEYGIDEDAAADMVLPCTVDIYRDSILPARIYFDLTDILEPMMEQSGIAASDYYVEITFMEYDSVEEIIVPDEALEAEEEGTLKDFDGVIYFFDRGDSGPDPSEAGPL